MKKIEVYGSDDYAGVSLTEEYEDDWNFYYGYEVTDCPMHGEHREDCDDTDCSELEWCFQARKNGEEIARYTESELGEERTVKDMVLKGIGKMIVEGKLIFK